MKKCFLGLLTLCLSFILSFQADVQVAAQNDSPYQNNPNQEEMSALRRGLIETLNEVKSQHPEIIVSDIDIHKHEVTDKYVYRIGASSATYSYEAISYDKELFLYSRPIPEKDQAVIIELINKRNERTDDRLNCDMITNLMRKHFKNAKISDWHFDDNRFELSENKPKKINNQTQSVTQPTENKLETDIFWIVDLIEQDRKFRVKIDAFSGDFVVLNPNENYEIDTVSSRMNYYLRFYADQDSSVPEMPAEAVYDYSMNNHEESILVETQAPQISEQTSQVLSSTSTSIEETSTESSTETSSQETSEEDLSNTSETSTPNK